MNEQSSLDFPKDIPALTSLRFYAALLTAFFHIEYLSGLEFPLVVTRIFVKGYIAVDFFFILSGFILTHTYLKAIKENKFSYKNFLIRRLARIYPVHFFTLVCFVLIFLISTVFGVKLYDNALSLWDFFTNLILVQGWGTSLRLGYNQVSWSISAEWFAYLLFPLFVWGSLSMKRPYMIIAVALVLFALLWPLSLKYYSLNLTQVVTAGIIRIAPEFLLGIGLYMLALQHKCPLRSEATILILLLGMVLGFVLLIPDYVYIPVLCLIILIAAEQAREGRTGFLTHKWNIYLGRISYSFYMVQYLVWYLIMYVGVRIIFGYRGNDIYIYSGWFLSMSCIFITAILVYHFIEKPAQKWITDRYAPRQTPKEKDTDNVMI